MFRQILLALLLSASALRACELCAVYNASSARGESVSGFLLSISEQYVSFGQLQQDSRKVRSFTGDFLNKSYTHIVPTYNFTERLGLSLNVPVIYESYQRTDVRYLPGPPFLSPPRRERKSEFGIGDLSLIGRWTAIQISEMQYGLNLNLLAGVKLPSGDDARLEEEAGQFRNYQLIVPGGTHPPAITGVHRRDISFGSGAFDGIFGLTMNARWKRFFFNSQFQYYLRGEGSSGYSYGDELMVSGGPGIYLLVKKAFTLNAQLLVAHEIMERDSLFGIASPHTGSAIWYAGPQFGFSWRSKFSALFGVDLPLAEHNRGLQNLPEWRIHGGVTWRF